jgi:hypothetical protein
MLLFSPSFGDFQGPSKSGASDIKLGVNSGIIEVRKEQEPTTVSCSLVTDSEIQGV